MAGIIQMPADQRYAAIDQAAYNFGQGVANRQQQQHLNDALANAVALYKQANAPIMQQNQQNLNNYQSLDDLNAQLYNLKTQAEQPGVTPEQMQQYAQQGNDIRTKIAALPGITNADSTKLNAAQYMQAEQPIIQSAYQKAITPVNISPDQIMSNAIQAVKNSHGALDLNTAMNLGNTMTAGYSQQNQDQIKKLQAKHDSIIVGHLQSQFADALKNKNYGAAAQISMQLEPYGVKTPEFISKILEPPMSPYQQQTLTLKQQEISDREQGIGGYGRAPGRSSSGSGTVSRGGGIGRVGGFTPTQQRAQTTAYNNAADLLGRYDPNGQLQSDGTYKPYTFAQQTAFNKASRLVYPNGGDTPGSNSNEDQQQNNYDQAQAWQDRYNNVLQDIQNSGSDEERQQKVNYYEKSGELQQFRDSGLNPDNDIAYIGGANNGNQSNDANNDSAWYDQQWRQIKANNPDWTDQQVTDYMTSIINGTAAAPQGSGNVNQDSQDAADYNSYLNS